MTDPDIDAKAQDIVDGLCTPVSRSAGGVETALLPCPFCGGEPSKIFVSDECQIACENECAAGPFVDGNNEAEAVKSWNTRSPTPQIAEGVREKWRHEKRGSIVEVEGRGRAQAATRPIEDMDPVTIYKHGDEWWVRRTEEFEDGRFVALSPQAQAGET